MQLNPLLTDDEAVSPVIGVILMVAITVILAAVIGTFVLGLGDQIATTTPQASFTFDLEAGTSDSLTITHTTGDSIPRSQLSVVISGASASGDTDPNVKYAWDSFSTGSGDVSAGDTATVDADAVDVAPATDGDDNNDVGDLTLDTATVRVTWESSNGEDTATLGKWTGPNA